MKTSGGWVFCLVLLLALAACAPLKAGLTNQSNLELEVISTPVVTISRADAYFIKGQLVISGAIRRLHEVKLPGHIDILVVGSDGVHEAKSVAAVPGLSSKRKGALSLPFMAHFALEPASVSKVIIKYHPRPGAQGGCQLCS